MNQEWEYMCQVQNIAFFISKGLFINQPTGIKKNRKDSRYEMDDHKPPCFDPSTYSLVNVYIHKNGKSSFLIGKPSMNGPFSKAMLVYQRVCA